MIDEYSSEVNLLMSVIGKIDEDLANLHLQIQVRLKILI